MVNLKLFYVLSGTVQPKQLVTSMQLQMTQSLIRLIKIRGKARWFGCLIPSRSAAIYDPSAKIRWHCQTLHFRRSKLLQVLAVNNRNFSIPQWSCWTLVGRIHQVCSVCGMFSLPGYILFAVGKQTCTEVEICHFLQTQTSVQIFITTQPVHERSSFTSLQLDQVFKSGLGFGLSRQG